MSSLSAPASDSVSLDPDQAASSDRLVRVEGTDHAFVVRPGEPILTAARRAGVWLPFECGWGSCGVCKATLVDGEVELLFGDAPAVDARDRRRRRTITCQTTAVSDLTLKVSRLGPFEERPTRDHGAELVAKRVLAPDVSEFRFRLDQPADFRPGQYAILDLAPGLRRCYSMAGLPGAEVSFVAKRYAGRPGSCALHATPVGGRVPMALPFGDMWLRPDSARTVLIAGGTGVAPILALLQQLDAEGCPHPVTVVYGANTPADLVCWDELAASVDRLADAELHGVVVRPDDGWRGWTGFVTEPLRSIVAAADRCYLAGPPPMVDAALAVLREKGVGLDRVHYDRFG